MYYVIYNYHYFFDIYPNQLKIISIPYNVIIFTEIHTNVNATNAIPNELSVSKTDNCTFEEAKSLPLEYTTYSKSGRINNICSYSSLSSNYQIQSALNNLGFYTGPTDGNLSSTASVKAIRNFQLTYGLSTKDGMTTGTKTMLENANNKNTSIYTSSELNKLSSSLSLDTKQKRTFAQAWTFLELGMGLNSVQISGVLGNIYAESAFSPDNAQDSTKDIYGNSWNRIINSSSVNNVSDIFLDEIESPISRNYTERRNYSQTIYNQMKGY